MSAFIWSVRRELWEHGWVYRLPLMLGGVFIAVATVQTGMSLAPFDAVANPMSAAMARRLSNGFDTAARVVMFTGVVVALVYCAEALHSERHDRSILFWRSLPVGDGTVIAAKSAIPFVFTPLLGLTMILVVQLIARLTFAGTGGQFQSLFASPLRSATEAVVGTLWIAPVYAWVMLVSARARRAVLLVALLPLMLVSMVERIATDGTVIRHALFQRGVGRYWPTGHLEMVGGVDSLQAMPATALVASLSFWLGILVAAVMLAAVVRARRSAEIA